MTLATHQHSVQIPSGEYLLEGILNIPADAVSVIAFAHGSGSGRFSPRNQLVAGALQRAGMATLLLDLLEEDEAGDRDKVFDIELLAERLQSAADWLQRQRETHHLRLGYFGASTGAAAALVAAARHPQAVAAVVSRGGRPDLAWQDLPAVHAPTRLIVGSRDLEVLHLNEQALLRLTAPKDLVIVPAATHLFPEHGALEQVADLARAWFARYLDVRQPPQ
jgi:putative phosphoribosyl transferase